MTSESITIGIVPRERFALTAEVIRRVVQHTDLPFKLLVVDCNFPEPCRQEVAQLLGPLDDAKVLKFEQYLLPNESRQAVLAASDSTIVCLLDNDVLVKPGWLPPLIKPLREAGRGVARPQVLEGPRAHFDRTLGALSPAPGIPAGRLSIGGSTDDSELDLKAGTQQVQWLEMHALAFHHQTLQQIPPLDSELNTREHIDLALVLRQHQQPIFFVPGSVVRFVPPPPVRANERDFFSFRWDLDTAKASRARIKSRWHLVAVRDNSDWIALRHWRKTWPGYVLRTLCKPINPLIGLWREMKRPWINGQGLMKHLSGLWQDALSRRKFSHLAGVQADEFKIAIDAAHSQTLTAGIVQFVLEHRPPGSLDTGGSLHVFTDTPEDGRRERIRFDCLEDRPHYHYVLHDAGISQKFWIDPLLVPDPVAWCLQQIDQRLADMLEAVGGRELGQQLDCAAVGSILPELEHKLRTMAPNER